MGRRTPGLTRAVMSIPDECLDRLSGKLPRFFHNIGNKASD